MEIKKKLILGICLIVFFSTAHGAIPGKYEVEGPMPKEHSLDVVLLREIFSFTCQHCNNFNKKIHILKKRFGNKIKLVSNPIGWSGPNPGRLFYIAQKKGKGEQIKDFIFSAVFDSGIKNINDMQTLKTI